MCVCALCVFFLNQLIIAYIKGHYIDFIHLQNTQPATTQTTIYLTITPSLNPILNQVLTLKHLFSFLISKVPTSVQNVLCPHNAVNCAHTQTHIHKLVQGFH